MPAYVTALIYVEDPSAYREYQELSPDLIARHGGRFAARSAKVTTLEGDHYAGRLVLLEFPSREAALAWYQDPDYQRIAQIRRDVAESRVLLIDGESVA